MTKEKIKTIVIVVLIIAVLLLVWQSYIEAVEIERRAMQDVHLELYSIDRLVAVAETEEEWELGIAWIRFKNEVFQPYPRGEAAKRVLEVCKKISELEFGSAEYEEVKEILGEKWFIGWYSSLYQAYLVISDEENFARLEEILGI